MRNDFEQFFASERSVRNSTLAEQFFDYASNVVTTLNDRYLKVERPETVLLETITFINDTKTMKPYIKSKVNVSYVHLALERHDPTKGNISYLVIGAHLDTHPESPGIAEGSGCVAVLQSMRILSGLSLKLNMHNIHFVFFDGSKLGYMGSEAFVEKFILSHQYYGLKSDRNAMFLGAIIVDSVLNFQSSKDSQMSPPSYRRIFKDNSATQDLEKDSMAKDIMKNGNRGNFIAVYGRQHSDKILMDSLLKIKNTKAYKFNYAIRIFNASIADYINKLDYIENDVILQGDQMSFWSPELKFRHKKFIPNAAYQFDRLLPAIKISDTSWLRKYQWDCFEQPCDNLSQLNPANLGFLYNAVQLVTLTAHEVARTSRIISASDVNPKRAMKPVPTLPVVIAKPFHLPGGYLVTAFLTTVTLGVILVLHLFGYWSRFFIFADVEEQTKSKSRRSSRQKRKHKR